MRYILNLFSPETWQAFREHGESISGFSEHQRGQAEKSIAVGDVFLCYMVRLSRWCGALRVKSPCFIDRTPLFSPENDKFVVRFEVEPIVALPPELSIPINSPNVWSMLSWTKDVTPRSVGWAANFQRSLRYMPNEDGAALLKLLRTQLEQNQVYPYSKADERALRGLETIKLASGASVKVEIPEEDEGEVILDQLDPASGALPTEAHEVQGLLAEIGAKMGFRIWLPKADRSRVQAASRFQFSESLIEALPLNYNEATVRTIEQIDVLWLRGRSIARAFEVEHTTAIYSGLLRMADLVALQPDIKIPLHIVAPDERHDRVLEQIRRPAFSVFETGPLSSRCSLITYSSVKELSNIEYIEHLNSSIISQFQEEADAFHF